MEELIKPFLNFAILVGVLVYFLREPLKQFVFNRHVRLKDELTRVSKMLRDARIKFEEFSAKLKAIDAEIGELRARFQQDAGEMGKKVVADAKGLSAAIISDSKISADMLFADLKGQLYGELADQVLMRAEKLLTERLTGDDQARIRHEFSKEVEGAR